MTASSAAVITELCRAFAARVDGTVADLGPRDRDVPARRVQLDDQGSNVLLRRLLTLAARQQQNTNGLLRQYFPKKTDLSTHAPDELQAVVDQLNDRPRAVLKWQTPAEVYRAAKFALIA